MRYETSVILSHMYLKGGLDPFVTVRQYELMLYLCHRIAKQKNIKSTFLNNLDFFFDNVKDFTLYNLNLDIAETIFGTTNKSVNFIPKELFNESVRHIRIEDSNFLVIVDHLVNMIEGFETDLGLELLAVTDYLVSTRNTSKLYNKIVNDQKRFSERQFTVAKNRLKNYTKVKVAS